MRSSGRWRAQTVVACRRVVHSSIILVALQFPVQMTLDSFKAPLVVPTRRHDLTQPVSAVVHDLSHAVLAVPADLVPQDLVALAVVILVRAPDDANEADDHDTYNGGPCPLRHD